MTQELNDKIIFILFVLKKCTVGFANYNYGTDNHGNECLSGNEEATQYTGRTNGGFSKENSSGNTGQMIGCAGRVSGSGHFEAVPAKLPGQRIDPLFKCWGEILL